MSLPIGDILKTLEGAKAAQSIVSKAAKDTKLYNPDIPDSRKASVGRKITRDKFYSSMKLPATSRSSQGGYALARSPGLPNLDPRKQEFMLEGAIDPANIRHRHDPLNAPPHGYATGAEGFKYQLGQSTERQRSSVPLIVKARASYAGRMARLVPMPQLPVKAIAVSAEKLISEGANTTAKKLMGV